MFESVVDWLKGYEDSLGAEVFGSIVVLVGALVVLSIAKRGIRRWSKRVDSEYV